MGENELPTQITPSGSESESNSVTSSIENEEWFLIKEDALKTSNTTSVTESNASNLLVISQTEDSEVSDGISIITDSDSDQHTTMSFVTSSFIDGSTQKEVNNNLIINSNKATETEILEPLGPTPSMPSCLNHLFYLSIIVAIGCILLAYIFQMKTSLSQLSDKQTSMYDENKRILNEFKNNQNIGLNINNKIFETSRYIDLPPTAVYIARYIDSRPDYWSMENNKKNLIEQQIFHLETQISIFKDFLQSFKDDQRDSIGNVDSQILHKWFIIISADLMEYENLLNKLKDSQSDRIADSVNKLKTQFKNKKNKSKKMWTGEGEINESEYIQEYKLPLPDFCQLSNDQDGLLSNYNMKKCEIFLRKIENYKNKLINTDVDQSNISEHVNDSSYDIENNVDNGEEPKKNKRALDEQPYEDVLNNERNNKSKKNIKESKSRDNLRNVVNNKQDQDKISKEKYYKSEKRNKNILINSDNIVLESNKQQNWQTYDDDNTEFNSDKNQQKNKKNKQRKKNKPRHGHEIDWYGEMMENRKYLREAKKNSENWLLSRASERDINRVAENPNESKKYRKYH